MHSFKLFLTLLTWVAVSSAAFAQNTPKPAATEPPAAAAPVAPEAPKDAKDAKSQTQFIGYAWPFADRDIATELGQGPVVLELFSTQACIFCPVADRFFNDLIVKAPSIIGLSCHIDYLNVKSGSLSIKACTDRQYDYGTNIQGGSVYTPQMVVNGKKETTGFSYENVYKLLLEASKTPPAAIGLQKGDGATYALDIPAVKLTAGKPAFLKIIQYRKPTKRVVAEGPNMDMDMNYNRVVSSVTTQDWAQDKSGKAETLTLEIKPDEDAAGVVVMIQSTERILAVGEAHF